MERLLDQIEAARLLRLSPRTLERHRVAGTGPQFIKLGRLVKYAERDLAEWVERGKCTSTSETARSSGWAAKNRRSSTSDIAQSRGGAR